MALIGIGLPSNLLQSQTTFTPLGMEYSVSGPLEGDQVAAQVVIGDTGGMVIWQDNTIDGAGWGISAQRLNDNYSPDYGIFRVNEIGLDDQENPQLAQLKDGNWVFIWQGGQLGFQKVYARFMDPSGVFITGDILVNAYTNEYQIDPVLAPLANGNVIIVWSSYGQDGYMQGIFGQVMTPTGAKIGQEFQINQYPFYNQRTPAVAAFANGGFVVGWISEQQRFVRSVDVFARLFDDSGRPKKSEFVVNSQTNTCANPVLATAGNGSFLVAWSQDHGRLTAESIQWDVLARSFDAQGNPLSGAFRVNSTVTGSQFGPRLAARSLDYLVVWTALGQDGSQEGVFGQFLNVNGTRLGDEFQVNSTQIGRQINPAAASDGNTQHLVTWSSFNGVAWSFDVFGQRYVADSPAAIPQPPPPHVNALSQSRLMVTWPGLAGYELSTYELFVDSQAAPQTLTTNYYVATGFAPGTMHSFRLRYQLADGRQSLLSEAASGVTWGEDLNGDGLPDDWQRQYWGPKDDQWKAGSMDTDGDGATNFQELLAGTSPIDPFSVLRTQILAQEQGLRLIWNTQPGSIYQVQISSNFQQWQPAGVARFAAESTDSVPLTVLSGAAYYRIIRIR